jgi:hypothetical protein
VVEGYFPDRPHHITYVQIEEDRSSPILSSHSVEGSPEERTGVPTSQAQALLAVASGQVAYVRTGLSLGCCRSGPWWRRLRSFSPCPGSARRSVPSAHTFAGGSLCRACRRHLRWTSPRELSTTCLICRRTGSQLGHCGSRLRRRKNQVPVRSGHRDADIAQTMPAGDFPECSRLPRLLEDSVLWWCRTRSVSFRRNPDDVPCAATCSIRPDLDLIHGEAGSVKPMGEVSVRRR